MKDRTFHHIILVRGYERNDKVLDQAHAMYNDLPCSRNYRAVTENKPTPFDGNPAVLRWKGLPTRDSRRRWRAKLNNPCDVKTEDMVSSSEWDKEVVQCLLGWLEVPVNESLWFHAVEIRDALSALHTPAHGVGRCVVGEWLGAVQHCGTGDILNTHRMFRMNRV